ncbi:DUF1446-domain-containing protein [Tilletiaria anomala UBC 951]|uniref:DUF1446-domain-containing protein n=1 Tax=Tilletiaria anomala (strain ATCC 24038 / CBS 436.72 / UBC 951) TaxID=1037660 RepID=A0A066WC41_TILAU|nr:DUF1446-domain-containing protein [Tilletiaria anomala UBC 951]KDN51301.1 DUF1446-domain-containing protein [Tilletiaria anomala UBC 951]
MPTQDKEVRIGCYSAFWGDSPQAAFQMVHQPSPPLHYLVADYLAEVTMGLLARRSRMAKAGKAKPGYIEEIVPLVIAPLLASLQANGTKLIINAGGLDPVGLKNTIETEVKRQGMDQGTDAHKVAAVWGDDLHAEWEQLVSSSSFTQFSHFNIDAGPSLEPLLHLPKPGAGKGSDTLLSLNAYIGAAPIAAALDRGATIIITGRCADSALVLAPLMHEFDWPHTANEIGGCGNSATQDLQRYYDRLATASLAGHIIECGAQATGGNFTDWKEGAFSGCGGWSNMGYGIVTFPRSKDGLVFDVSKPPETGGIVSVLSVGEQMLYEVLDPENYILPDVTLDLSQVELKQVERELVRVSKARGKPPPSHLKCTAILSKGYKISGELCIVGEEAKLKAEMLGRAILTRAGRAMNMRGFAEFEKTRIECVGAEAMFGAHSRLDGSREVVLRISASHKDPKALMWMALELAQAATSTAPGITGLGAGRVAPSPLFSTQSVLIPREAVECKTLVAAESAHSTFRHATQGSHAYHRGGSAQKRSFPQINLHASSSILPLPDNAPHMLAYTAEAREIPSPQSAYSLSHQLVPLIRIAVGRSGDKGDSANIAFIARRPEFYGIIQSQVTCETVRSYLSHLLTPNGPDGQGGSEIVRFLAPGVNAVNFVVSKCLGGGGLLGLQYDRQAKTFAQVGLSAIKVRVPSGLLAAL